MEVGAGSGQCGSGGSEDEDGFEGVVRMGDSDVPEVVMGSLSCEAEVAPNVDVDSVGLPLCLDEVGELVNCPAFGDAAQVKVDREGVANQEAGAGVGGPGALDMHVLHSDDEGVCVEEW